MKNAIAAGTGRADGDDVSVIASRNSFQAKMKVRIAAVAMPGELAYVAGKGAIHQLTLSLAAELAPRRITVNTVDPGPTDTGYATPDIHAAALATLPMGRWGEPDDAARLIAFLASDDAGWITGQVITSAGGEGLVSEDPRAHG